jgi:hypothetical protein
VLPRKLERIPDAGARARARVQRAVTAELAAGKQRRPDSAWPMAGHAVAVLPRPAASTAPAAAVRASVAPVAAGRLPMTIARTPHAEGNETRIGISILARGPAMAAHVAGLMMKVTEPAKASGSVKLSVDYRSFANAAAGNYGQRKLSVWRS